MNHVIETLVDTKTIKNSGITKVESKWRAALFLFVKEPSSVSFVSYGQKSMFLEQDYLLYVTVVGWLDQLKIISNDQLTSNTVCFTKVIFD